MAAKAPKKGDTVIHHGREHTITGFPVRARMVDGKAVKVRGVEFENERYKVTALLTDEPGDPGLLWSAEDHAWYLFGRLLSRNERAVLEAITGTWPTAASHPAMRDMLDSVDLGNVDHGKLRGVILRRKADARVRPPKEGEELKSGQVAYLQAYAEAALAQVTELRALRLEA